MLDVFYFFFNDTATTEIYTLSLHDALPISVALGPVAAQEAYPSRPVRIIVPFAPGGGIDMVSRPLAQRLSPILDRKSTRLNSSHAHISSAVFCLTKKKQYCNSTRLNVSHST